MRLDPTHRCERLRTRVTRVARWSEQGQFLGIDWDDTAFVPAARAMELFNRDGLTEINLTYAHTASAKAVAAAAERVLSSRHGRADFTVTTQEEMPSTSG